MIPYTKDGAFYFPLRVYYEDTDAAGVVYHSNYLNFCERARTEWLRQMGNARGALKEQFGVQFAVRRASIDYRKPARLDDFLVVETRLQAIGKVRMAMRQTVTRDGVTLAVAEIELVCISDEFLPTALPASLLAKLPPVERMEEVKK